MLGRLADVRSREEAGAALLAFIYFFTLLCGYALLKPLRDALATAGGVKDLPWLFTATFAVMLVAVPVFSGLMARWPRRRVLPWVYRFFLAWLVAFFALLELGVAPVAVARTFFVFVSVYNLFIVSVFWSFMSDLFSREQGQRLFGLIAAGGSAGMLVGPLLVRLLVEPLGPARLLLVAAALLEVSAQCVRWLSRHSAQVQPQAQAAEEPLGGSSLAGLKLLATSPLLLGLAGQTLLYALSSTFLYYQQVLLVQATGLAARTAAFASIEFWGQLLTLVLQAVVTGQVLPRLGLRVALAVAPMLTALGFCALAAWPSMAMLVIFKALRGAAHHAFERPGREVLFTTVGREARYKAKGFIDTVVYRGSDSLSSWLQQGLAALGLGSGGLALAAVPVAGLWLGVSLWLARSRPAAESTAPLPGVAH